ncbi:MAG: zinc-ribbon domain-containing protein [Sphingomonadaceae bacterium]|nr:zinc-ribbon domain-containing protein [Sphingomonadaceae bacterium]
MEITCPNCGARFRVPADAIPPEGRDIVCANCRQSWHQQATAEALVEAAPTASMPAAPVGPPPPVIEPPAAEPAPVALRETVELSDAAPIPRRPGWAEPEPDAREGSSLVTWLLLIVLVAVAVGAYLVLSGRIELR